MPHRWAAAACAVAVLSIATAGCGDTHAKQGLTWVRPPTILAPRDLPTDRVAIGRVRNASAKTIHLTASRIVVRDADGRRLNSSGAYTASFAHGLFGAFQRPSQLPRAELVRLGRLLDLAPGVTAPFFAAWRLPRGSREPVRIDYGGGSLPVTSRAEPSPR